MANLSKTHAQIEALIPLAIFEVPSIHEKSMNLFGSFEKKINERINEIMEFIKVSDDSFRNNVASYFKIDFYKLILKEAVEITFSAEGSYDAISAVLSLLTEEKIDNAIIGETMIKAAEKEIRNIPADSALSFCLNGSKILLLEKQFLGRHIFPQYNQESDGTKSNLTYSSIH